MRIFRILSTVVAGLAAQAQSKAVFAHFMVGNANNYTQSDWETDIGLAQEAHIDAFALNIANDVGGVTAPLQLAFYVASQMGFKLFFSFDYAGNGAWDKQDVISLCTSYCNNPAYYHTNGGPLLSTFEGPENAADWHEIKASTGCFFIPDWSSLGAQSALEQSSGVADALFSWAAWPWGDFDMNTYTDASYWMYLEQAGGKPYMMPASPWFYTNLPGYDKNWLWRGDDIWYDRWVQIIYNQPDFVEIISWNDYGESHYIGPLYDKAMEAFTVGEAPLNYASGMPHDGWRAFLPYVIDLYKEGTATITQEGVQGWWRRAAASACADGSTTGNTASQLQIEFSPTSLLTDKIFFSALLDSAADVSVTVGGTALEAAWTWTPDDGIGLYHGSVDFGSATGDVVITISRSGQTVATLSPGDEGSIGSQSCVNGLQNWNAYVASAWGDSISATPTRTIDDQACINGTGYQNFADLCDFSCKYGYCDHSACVCKAMGSPSATPSAVNPTGYPAAGLDASYSGVCAFDCEHGHCPATVCSLEESPLTTPTVSDFSPPACVAGTAAAGEGSALSGLCSYACNYGFCPYLVCTCTSQGALVEPPSIVDGQTGEAGDGVEDHGLCSFACQRGEYCPSPTCVNTTATETGGGGDGGVFIEDPGWSSYTGQYCYKSACSETVSWGSQENIATGPFRDDCPDGQYRVVVCPVGETPGSCQWRGTGPFCEATCEAGEVAIATSKRGSGTCLIGEQALCCESLTWTNLLSFCQWTSETTCPMAGQVSVASREHRYCWVQGSDGCRQWSSYTEIFCCDADFPNCEWASCNNNICSSQQIEVTLDEYGASGYGCLSSSFYNYLGYGAPQALCCDNPENVNPFLPVELDWIFPTLPPDSDIPVFDMQHIESTLNPDLTFGPLEPFAMVVIDGPADLVSSLSKRHGAHVEFLDCEPGKKVDDMAVYTARYICTDNTENSNCDDVHVGGAEGTVVKLPEECGYAAYGVVHEIKESSDQRVPPALRADSAAENLVVHEVTFSYDFRRVRRAAEDDPVYVRIDYSSMSEWWSEIIDQPPSRKRDTDFVKRFWSASDATWKSKIDGVRLATEGNTENQLLGISNPSFSQLIYHQTSDTCAATTSSKRALSDDGFLSVKLDGWATALLRWGYTMVGTISPTLNLEEAHGFFDASVTSYGRLWVDGEGSLDIDGTLPEIQLFGDDGITDFGWSHPGIVSFKPTLNMGVEMSGSGNLNANFTVNYFTLPGESMIQTNSVNMGDLTGSLGDVQLTNGYKGAVDASPASDSGSSEVVFGLRITPNVEMDFTVFDYSSSSDDTALASAHFFIDILHKIQVVSDGTEVQVVDSYDPILAGVLSDGVSSAWTEEGEATFPINHGVLPAVVYTGEGETPAERNAPDLSGDAAYTGDFMQCSGASGNTNTMTCLLLANVSDIDTDLQDDYDGENAQANLMDKILERAGLLASRTVPFLDVAAQYLKPKGTPTRDLAPRSTGTARAFTIRDSSGNTFTSNSSEYLTGNSGRVLITANPNAGFMNLVDQYDCVGAAITDNAGPSSDLASEHLLEQNLVAGGWQFLLTGRAEATSQSAQYDAMDPTTALPSNIMGDGSYFRMSWNSFDPSGSQAGLHPDPTLSPEREMWNAIGSLANPEYLVNLQQAINAFKSRMMRGIAGIGSDRWTANSWDDTSEATGYIRAMEAMSEIRLFLAVINYLNHPTANGPFIASMNRIFDIMTRFDAAIARNSLNGGVATSAGTLWREYIYQVVIARTSGSYGQYRQLLQRLRSAWQQELGRVDANTSQTHCDDIDSIIRQITALLAEYDPVTNANPFGINTAGLFADPSLRRKRAF